MHQPDQCAPDRRLDVAVGERRAMQAKLCGDSFQQHRSLFGRQRAGGDHHLTQLIIGKRYRVRAGLGDL